MNQATENHPAFEIHRRVGLFVALALVCLALAAGFVAVGIDQREPVWAVPAAVLVLLAVVHLAAARDPRTPLLVADDHGVRLRSGDGWVGLLWSEMGEIRVEPREGWRHDPRVKVVSLDGRRIHAVPVGPATTVTAEVAEQELAQRRGPAAY